MQEGSLVECIRRVGDGTDILTIEVGTILTVDYFTSRRAFVPVEIKFPVVISPQLIYVGLDPSYFREVQPPMTISIDEIIKEPQCEPV